MTTPVHSKTFKSGNSVALRLPKGLAIGPGEQMAIEQNGDVLTVRRVKDQGEMRCLFLEMLADLDAMPKPRSIQKREPFEFPDRPGL